MVAALELLQVGLHVLKTTISGTAKTVLAQLGNVAGTGVAERDQAEWFQHDGFISLPPTATPGKSASEVVSATIGATFATETVRGSSHHSPPRSVVRTRMS